MFDFELSYINHNIYKRYGYSRLHQQPFRNPYNPSPTHPTSHSSPLSPKINKRKEPAQTTPLESNPQQIDKTSRNTFCFKTTQSSVFERTRTSSCSPESTRRSSDI